jgi:hypothetical protein
MCGPVSVNLNGRSGADRPFHHARRPGAEARRFALGIVDPLREADLRAHAGHRPHEILDHAVGLRVVDVEAVQLAVAHQVDAGLFLRIDDHAHRVGERLLGGRGGEPIGQRVGADDGGLDSRHGANCNSLIGSLARRGAHYDTILNALRRPSY